MMDLRPTPTTISWIDQTGSTNTDLLHLVNSLQPPAEGWWLVAERQTAGRGRRNRAWQDGTGNFTGSTAIRIRHSDPPAASLSLVAGLALHEVMAPLVPAGTMVLKWPNDLLVRGAKIAGILLERCADHVVVGVGVNLSTAPDLPDRKTVAVSAFGPSPDRSVFATNLAQSMALEVERWRCFGLEPVRARWMSAAHPVGTCLRVHAPGGQAFVGQFCGLDDSGALCLRMADNTMQVIAAGDVLLVGV